MSWDIFTSNMKSFYNQSATSTDSNVIANKLAMEYDAAIKRGANMIHSISVSSGNVNAMREGFNTAFRMGSLSPAPFDIIGALGFGVVRYWTSVSMKLFPTPALPAPGTTQNIITAKSILLSPGIWSPQSPLPPVPSPDLFLNLFVLNSKLHLSTISGLVTTVSLYPTVPVIPGPGFIAWQGYTVS
jgi:hypothetical protein